MNRSQQNCVNALKLQIESLKRVKEADDQHLDKLKSALKFVTQQRDELDQQTSHLNRQIQSLEAQLADTQELLQEESRQKLAAQSQTRNFHSDLETIKDQGKETTEQQLKYENELVALRAQLTKLSRHCVYGFFNKDKNLIYVGQSTDFNCRISRHLAIATGKITDQSDATPFHELLAVELKRGIYVMPLFERLDELNANDKENALILELKKKGLCGNVADGRWTERFLKLSDNERDMECEECFAEVMRMIQNVLGDKLVTEDNYKTMFKFVIKLCVCRRRIYDGNSKCTACRFIKQKRVKCKRENCKTLGVGDNGYCWMCYHNNSEKIGSGETLPPLQTKHSTRGFDYNTSFQRALVIAMQNLGSSGIVNKVKLLFPKIDMVAHQSVDKWIKKKIKLINSAKDLATFLKANQSTYDGLTSAMVDHILVYEHQRSKSPNITTASDRLTKLFYCIEDKDKFSLEIVQDKFTNIETIKQSLKRTAIDSEDESEVEPKKRKVEE